MQRVVRCGNSFFLRLEAAIAVAFVSIQLDAVPIFFSLSETRKQHRSYCH